MSIPPAARAKVCFLLLAGALPAQLQRYGAGCASGAGLPWDGLRPSQALDRVPIAGQACTWEIETRQPGASLLLLLGASSSSWQGQPLPLPLGNIGLPGCALAVSLDVVAAARADATGRLHLPLNLPASSLGARLHTQILARGTNAFGQPVHGLSEGLRLRVSGPPVAHSVVTLPDTQYYSQFAKQAPIFKAQTSWVLANQASRAIAFVSHVGDIVQNGGTNNGAEWTRAVGALQQLDGKIAHGICIGNHDYDVVGDKSGASAYTFHFGPQRYQGRAWYLGSSPKGTNHAQRISVGTRSFLHLSLEWRPGDDAIAWAQDLLARNPGVPAWVSTHEYLRAGNPALRSSSGHSSSSGGANSGEDLYRKLVEPFPQIFFVTCGHLRGEGRRSSTTALGQLVQQTLADYQFEPNGGNGWLRIMRLDPQQKRLEIRTLSPTYRPGITSGPDYSQSPSSNFNLSYDEGAHRARLQQTKVLRLRQGQDFGQGTYQACLDTQISAARPGQAGSALPDIFVDGNGDQSQGLLRFAQLVGSGPLQIPARTRIRRAILTLTCEGSNAQSADGGSLYRMVADWDAASTYLSLGLGVQLGREALTRKDADSAGRVAGTGTLSLDVTAAVQDWVDGVMPNRGWLIQANGTDGWGVRSSDWGTVTERPMLTILF